MRNGAVVLRTELQHTYLPAMFSITTTHSTLHAHLNMHYTPSTTLSTAFTASLLCTQLTDKPQFIKIHMRLYMYLLSTQLFVCLHLLLKLIIATGSYYKLGQNRIYIMQATLTQPNSFPIAYSINPIYRYSINKQFHYISLYVHAVTHKYVQTDQAWWHWRRNWT